MKVQRCLALVWLLGCGGTESHAKDPAQDLAPDGEQASALIGPAGGTLRLTQGAGRGASMVIPPGALLRPIRITMHAVRVPDDVPKTFHPAGPYLDLGPDGLTFAKPVTVTLPTTHRVVTVRQRSSRGEWSFAQRARANDAGEMVATLTHFSGAVAGDENANGVPDQAEDPAFFCTIHTPSWEDPNPVYREVQPFLEEDSLNETLTDDLSRLIAPPAWRRAFPRMPRRWSDIRPLFANPAFSPNPPGKPRFPQVGYILESVYLPNEEYQTVPVDPSTDLPIGLPSKFRGRRLVFLVEPVGTATLVRPFVDPLPKNSSGVNQVSSNLAATVGHVILHRRISTHWFYRSGKKHLEMPLAFGIGRPPESDHSRLFTFTSQYGQTITRPIGFIDVPENWPENREESRRVRIMMKETENTQDLTMVPRVSRVYWVPPQLAPTTATVPSLPPPSGNAAHVLNVNEYFQSHRYVQGPNYPLQGIMGPNPPDFNDPYQADLSSRDAGFLVMRGYVRNQFNDRPDFDTDEPLVPADLPFPSLRLHQSLLDWLPCPMGFGGGFGFVDEQDTPTTEQVSSLLSVSSLDRPVPISEITEQFVKVESHTIFFGADSGTPFFGPFHPDRPPETRYIIAFLAFGTEAYSRSYPINGIQFQTAFARFVSVYNHYSFFVAGDKMARGYRDPSWP